MCLLSAWHNPFTQITIIISILTYEETEAQRSQVIWSSLQRGDKTRTWTQVFLVLNAKAIYMIKCAVKLI